jgi:8-oxo-dGTP diphosphatase
MKRAVHVVAGVLRASDGSILISQRPDHVHQGGLWEFPGGKLERGETPRQGLDRELNEELGVTVNSAHPLIQVRHAYPDRTILLDTWMVKAYTGVPAGREGQSLDWIHPEDLDPGLFPPADGPIITALRRPRARL